MTGGAEQHDLALAFAERERVDDVRPRPGQVLPEAVAEHDAVTGPGQDHVELRVASRVEAEVSREVHLGQDHHHVLRGDHRVRGRVHLANAVLGASVRARRGVVGVADRETGPVRDGDTRRWNAARESAGRWVAGRCRKEAPGRDERGLLQPGAARSRS